LILLLGLGSGRLAGSGYGNRWFAELTKPDFMPPGWLFALIWPVLYILMGLSVAMILHARGAQGRWAAIGLFLVLLALVFTWPPLFFAAHQVTGALYLITAIGGFGIVTTLMFARIRPAAAGLMLPFLLWIAFAAYLNFEVRRLNPHAETLVAPAVRTQI
jgi:tryptophan-rich sensory protein